MNTYTIQKSLSLHELISETLARLNDHYLLVFPEKTNADFVADCIEPYEDVVKNKLQFYGDKYVNLILKVPDLKEGVDIIPQLKPILASVAYCLDALNFWNQYSQSKCTNLKALELGWRNIAESRYWLALVIYNVSTKDIVDKTREEARKTAISKNAKKAAEEKGKKNQVFIEEAYRLVRERCPSDKWKNPSRARDGILQALEDFKKLHENNLDDNNFTDTVYKWLSRMPDIKEYVRKK